MPSNPYYDHGTTPTFRSPGRSADIRSELDLITTGFDIADQDITALENGKGAISGQVWTGTHAFPATTSIGVVTGLEISYLSGLTSGAQAQINTKAPINSPTFTGIPAAPTAAAGTNTTQLATTEFVTTANYYVALNDFTATSSTNISIARGSKSLTVETGKAFVAGMTLNCAYTVTPTIRMWGVVTSYNPTTGALVLNIEGASGSGTYNTWSVSLTGSSAQIGLAKLSFFGSM